MRRCIPGWANIRIQVYKRDQGICQVCKRYIPFNTYECGHIVDHCVGGSADLSNLLTMCIVCNRFKPIHSSIDDFNLWVKQGYWRRDLKEFLNSKTP